jgi:hypothetical protein
MMTALYPCGRCGDCCRQENILILDADLDRIAAHLGLKRRDFRTKFLKRIKGSWYLRDDNPCVFLGEDKRTCTIYSVRPTICVKFPYQTPWFTIAVLDTLKFQFGNGEPPRLTLYMPEGCPCRENLIERLKKATSDFFSDSNRVQSTIARGISDLHQDGKTKGV